MQYGGNAELVRNLNYPLYTLTILVKGQLENDLAYIFCKATQSVLVLK